MEKSIKERTISSVEVTSALPRARHVAGDEEKVLRMRYGARTQGAEALPRIGQGDPDLASELLLIEMDLLRQARARISNKVVPISSRTKDKIVRALRRK
jgi:hypothetical protein